MAVNSSSFSPFTKQLLFIFLLILGILMAAYVATSFINRKANFQLLPENTFHSQIELRKYKDDKGVERTYYALVTANQTAQDFYNCQFTIVDKGNLDYYHGFFKTYQEKNCYPISNPQPHYVCRLQNWLQRYFSRKASMTLPKFSNATSSELPLSRFYLYQSSASDSYTSKHVNEDIYSVLVSCNNAAGKTVQHVQQF